MEASELGSRESVGSRDAAATAAWLPIVLLTASFAILVVLYRTTFYSMISIWSRSGTFMHGYLILPISLWLVWEQREELRGASLRPEWRVLPLFVVLGVSWLAARLASVQVLEQYFAVSMIPIVVWGILGSELARRIAFPLAFLMLAVPVGEALIPPLIDFTAAFTVSALRLSGIPVLQEGNLLTLSNSQWSVVEACSGLRYLIACVTVGVLFAHLTYRAWWRRGLFLLAAIVVPILANGFRAYLTVLLGYLSDLRLAAGIDHLIYGWLFFGVVMMILFWVGSFFKDAPSEKHPRTERPSLSSSGNVVVPSGFVWMTLALLLAISIWPAWASYSDGPLESVVEPGFSLPASIAAWDGGSLSTGWRPHYVGAEKTASREYGDDQESVGVHVAYYRRQRQGAELVSSSNRLAGSDGTWRALEDAGFEVDLSRASLPVREVVLGSGEGRIRLWAWYWIGGARTTSGGWAKVLEAKGKLLGRPPVAAELVIYTEVSGDAGRDREHLRSFLEDGLAPIEARLSALAAPRNE